MNIARSFGFQALAPILLLVAALLPAEQSGSRNADYLSPTALAASSDGCTLYVACATAGRVAVFDTSSRRVTRLIAVPDMPLGLAVSSDGGTLYVTCAGPKSVVCVVNTATGEVAKTLPAGHTAMAPVLSPDGKRLFVCNRFNNEVQFIDLASRQTTRRVRVPREPVAAAITPSGQYLLVANHIHAGRADVEFAASSVSVLDVEAGVVCREILLPNGSTLLRDVRVSPDGKHAVVVHQIGRFHVPTTQLDRGWVNTSAASLIDVAALQLINTVLLDSIDSGAANPWAVAWAADGKAIVITHAGTREVSVVDFPALLAKLGTLTPGTGPKQPPENAASSRATDVPNDLTFLAGVRRRIPLNDADSGPRAVALVGSLAWFANYFSDTLSVLDLAAPRPVPETVLLGSQKEASQARRGELFFNDATLCFQGWQACSSCHSHDARVDGLNWDNLNDGIGNPKNAKSLLFAHQTPPSMWLGVRSNAHVAVRAGIRNSLFTVQPPEVAEALDAFLMSLQPTPSPWLVHHQLSPSARRGKQLFLDDTVGCADCHKGSYYTDQKPHDIGTAGQYDLPSVRFDTPSLIEVWRTAPYLHDGRATSVREVVTTFNRDDRHGATSQLTPAQVEDLVEFVLSL